ncbi:DMT family protein [Jatrophihabitans fulvus]
MSLAVAIPFGLASAAVYGTSIVVQHRVAQEQADDHGASAAGLIRLVKHPIFLLALAGDFVGFLLQLVALSTGPVVIIQPLVVLMLPVALIVGFLMGGHKPNRGDYAGVVAVLGGLAVFLALIGHPAEPRVPKVRFIVMTILIVLAVALAVCLVTLGRSKTVRGAAYGAAAGICFGTLAMLVDAASVRLADRGVAGLLDSPKGLVPIVGMFVVGTAGMILTQMSFQVGALGATLPANLAADPLVAVLLGALVLRESIPSDALHLLAYAACLAVVTAGAIKLANPSDGHLGEGRAAADPPAPVGRGDESPPRSAA